MSKKDGKPLVDDEVLDNIAKIFEEEGSDCWFSDDPQKFLGNKYKSEDFHKFTKFSYWEEVINSKKF